MLRMLSSVLTCLLLLLWCRVTCAYAIPAVVYSQRLQQVLTLMQQGAWAQALGTIGELERPRLEIAGLILGGLGPDPFAVADDWNHRPRGRGAGHVLNVSNSKSRQE